MTHSRILVTGASGLVGSQITGNVIHITSPTGDLRNKKTAEDIINFYADKERMGENAVDKISGNLFPVTNRDFTKGFPLKSVATISAPVGDAALIAAWGLRHG